MKQNSLYGMGLLGLGVLLAYLYRLQLPFALILILTELFIFPKWLRGKQRQKTEVFRCQYLFGTDAVFIPKIRKDPIGIIRCGKTVPDRQHGGNHT